MVDLKDASDKRLQVYSAGIYFILIMQYEGVHFSLMHGFQQVVSTLLKLVIAEQRQSGGLIRTYMLATRAT